MSDLSEQKAKIIAEAQAELAAEVAEAEKALHEARVMLDQEAILTVQTLLKHRDSCDDALSLNAAKYLAKIQGFEIERHQHEHKGSVVVHSNIPMGFDDEVGK